LPKPLQQLRANHPMIDARRKEHKRDISSDARSPLLPFPSLSRGGRKRGYARVRAHGAHNAARCYKEKLEAENHPRRAFQLLKSLQRRSAERISRVSKLSIVARCVPRRREIKREPTRHKERSPSLRGLCSCFLSRLLCFAGCDSSRFLYGPRVHA